MTETVNIAAAKSKLSALIDRAATGEEIVLSRAGRRVARLMAACRANPEAAWRLSALADPRDLFLEPMDEEDLRAAEGADCDEYGISRQRSKPGSRSTRTR